MRMNELLREPVSNDLITYVKLGEIVLFIPSLSLLVMGAARHLTSLPCWYNEWMNLCVCVFLDCDLAAGLFLWSQPQRQTPI